MAPRPVVHPAAPGAFPNRGDSTERETRITCPDRHLGDGDRGPVGPERRIPGYTPVEGFWKHQLETDSNKAESRSRVTSMFLLQITIFR